MLRVGLTGGIGSGKSAVAERLAALGAVVIDVDRLAREVVEPGTPGLEQVVTEFGREVVGPDGALDRKLLAAIVFADPQRLAALNAIVHPLVALRSSEIAAEAADDAVLVADVPLLVENNLEGAYDVVVVVDAPEDVRLRRLVERGMDEDDALARMAAQATREERLDVADFLVDNSGDLEALDRAVEDLWSELVEAAR